MGLPTVFQQTRTVFKYAVGGLRQGAAVHSLSIGIIALSLTALGAAAMVVRNVSRVADAWNRERVVTAFLAPTAQPAQIDALLVRARAHPGVQSVHHVDTREARTRLAAAMGGRARMLEQLGEGVVPTAVEVELTPSSPPQLAEVLAAELGSLEAVEEVAFGEQELERVEAVVGLLRAGAAVLAALIALVSVLVISNTLKLTVLARREEIEIMRLVGAGDVFVRAPFVLEGAIQGLVGAGLAGGLLVGLHQVLALQVTQTLSNAFGPVSLGAAPWDMVLWLCAVGLMLGVGGGLLGVSRFSKV